MMRPSADLPEVYVCLAPIDFRKGINGLAAMVERELSLNPFATVLYVFSNRRRDQVKILYWERNGFCLWQKRLEQDRFHWLRRMDSRVDVITGQQLNWLLDGYDIARFRPHKSLQYSSVS
ncbi:MAG: IS66 family insertion sequence element accessory protein TnpB [Magnetococcales bacterium]|nr:IS66 family insertion sequence element accessory protein TnpB [Magnetococcales bacterium]MBF0116878.1 IS66 family insertion sequence element accessory protein TnpB [Magnetococcales bacterium]